MPGAVCSESLQYPCSFSKSHHAESAPSADESSVCSMIRHSLTPLEHGCKQDDSVPQVEAHDNAILRRRRMFGALA